MIKNNTIGADSQCHLSEELKNAAWVLPRATVATATANYVMGFVKGSEALHDSADKADSWVVLTIMFVIGPDVDNVLNTPLGVPLVQIVLTATNFNAAAMVFACPVGLLCTCCLIDNVTTASRQLWYASCARCSVRTAH